MNRQYAIFAIGPVQSFIAASRKLEDLWGGSYLLSFLIKKALMHLEEICKEKKTSCDLIYPRYSPKEQQEQLNSKSLAVANYPNRITFTLCVDAETSQNILIELEKKVREELQRIADWAVNRVFNNNTQEAKQRVITLQEQARNQVDAFLEVNWIAYSFQEDEGQGRQEAERLFHALKGQRQMHYIPEKGLACTVYQRMDALCYEQPKPTDRYADLKRKLHNTWSKRNRSYQPSSKDDENARIRNNEYLCAISLVRRVARDFFQEEYGVGSEIFRKYESVVTIRPKDTTPVDGSHDSYYAVLLMDGDNMGQFFNVAEQEVRNTSQQLSIFASEAVPRIVEEHSGVLLYAGGDDVLALFPVQTVLSAAYSLRSAFGDEKNGLKGATASTGIAIGHKRTPLQQMLNQARALEKEAKSYPSTSNPQKNAFALSVLPRSGEFFGPTVLPWECEGSILTEELSKLVKLLSNVMSTSFIYQFSSTFQSIIDAKEQHNPEFLAEMVMLECRRLIDRSVYDKSKLSDLRVELSSLDMLYHHLQLEGLIDLFKILAFFNRKEDTSASIDVDAS